MEEWDRDDSWLATPSITGLLVTSTVTEEQHALDSIWDFRLAVGISSKKDRLKCDDLRTRDSVGHSFDLLYKEAVDAEDFFWFHRMHEWTACQGYYVR